MADLETLRKKLISFFADECSCEDCSPELANNNECDCADQTDDILRIIHNEGYALARPSDSSNGQSVWHIEVLVKE